MKAFAVEILTLFVLAIGTNAVAVDNAAAGPVPGADAALTNVTSAVDPCFWSGTAPFCAGSCPVGYVDCGRDGCGDGACCITGIKVFCCLSGQGLCPTSL
ncbi:hypothetical protein C8Q70DRAFT_995213 [Cubamyces menziesii]|uniref:Uncharacterized protein n=1 Tax=Trametes cubensis TaxID=1111947 RepID=A0AAD7XAS8_9APHY|nr:hypothetical protein C8Q70DRAFT_995213 [Cubamyces menziesii]KAJ8475060.1 hypothetical protein ONZ51_g6816 [Trametes cubensis]